MPLLELLTRQSETLKAPKYVQAAPTPFPYFEGLGLGALEMDLIKQQVN